jgi:putative ABC transport system ATP-binding protein
MAENTADTYISFQDVVRAYHNGDTTVRAADGMTFTLSQGHFSVIVGPSGAGKTTVLNILGGIDSVTEGAVTVDGRDITSLDKRQRWCYWRDDVGFVFQSHNLIPNLTALENVELASHTRKTAVDAKDILRDVGLESRMDKFPAQLSGGEQQRAAIARALAKNPKILLCDEPTGALDYETGKDILTLLQDTCKSRGVTVVVVTHNAAITPMADRIIKIKNGKVEFIGDNPDPVPLSYIEW